MMGVGMPTTLFLDEFGYQVWSAFGHTCYHVGSSVFAKQWRDVDVRLILPDEAYEHMALGDPKRPHENKKWVALTLAFSALGKEMTGLPIDFQIQQQSDANETYSQKDGCIRSALGCVARIRMEKPLKGVGQMTIQKHITLRVIPDDLTMEQEIDATIERSIAKWKGRPLVTDVRLQSISPFFRPDGTCFITMILDVEIEEV